MEKTQLKYFLAANSCEGFSSYFDKSYNGKDGWKAFIIKGGPGTGKSSFMKFFASKAIDKGIETLLCPCSSDPNSLDAVILPDKKIIIMDGTPPHTVEPVYNGVCEKILDFGAFRNDRLLLENCDEIISLTDKNKQLHKTVSHYLSAAGQLILDNYKTALACTAKEKAFAFAEKLCKKIIPKKSTGGEEWVRFIEGITPNGIVSYPKTLLNSCKNIIIIEDKYSASSNIIISTAKDKAKLAGYDIITLKNPFLPSLITDHIVIPQLSLCIATENEFINFPSETRRIHARRFTSNKQLHLSKGRIKFNKKATKELFVSAIETLNYAKKVHDDLEKYYISSMDFSSLTEFAEKFAKEILD